MTRAEYIDQRRAIRDARATRADRGLSRHPDGSGLHACPRCFSEGCALCFGTGYITDGHRDPLLRLKYARQAWVRRRDPSQYIELRKLCATPSWRLRLLEQCVRMDIALEGALQAWRHVA